jgi:hypothetical protein
MIGKLLYRYRTQFGHGLRIAWQRDVVRWRVLKTPPIYGLTDGSCEIHVLTCERDWVDLIWCLKSFFSVCDVRFRLCIHEDGSLQPAGLAALRDHFPEARVICRRESDERVGRMLRHHPRCDVLRRSNNLSLKVFDFLAYLESDRLFLLDSDILFFRRPTVLLQRVTDRTYARNSLNRDWGMGYSVEPQAVQARLDFAFQSHINSGLGLIHKASYDLDDFERWLEVPGILSHPHRIEQTLVALASSKFGHEFLPEEYDVRLEKTKPQEIVKHYTGPIRHLMYGEGLGRVTLAADAAR